jgi:hypothetical protein
MPFGVRNVPQEGFYIISITARGFSPSWPPPVRKF